MSITVSYTKEQISEIKKCLNDPIYFIENYCWVELKGSNKIIPFKLFEYQKDIIRRLMNKESLVILKSRRVGISWCIAAYSAWLINFNKGINGLFLSKKESDAVTLLNKPKFILSNLAFHDNDNIEKATKADWLLSPIVTNNNSELSIGWLNKDGTIANKSTLKSLTTTPNSGRGEDASLIFVDEAAFIEAFNDVVGSILPTTQGGGTFIIASTPDKAGGEFYNLCMKGKRAIEDGTNDLAYSYVENHWSQTDVSPEVIARIKSTMSASKAAQEYELRFGQSGDPVFPEENLLFIYKPLNENPDINSYLDEYRKSISISNRYYSGVDSAFGKSKKSDRNYSVFTALTSDGVQAFTYASRDITASQWGGYLQQENGINNFIEGKVTELHKLYPGVICIERNNFGNQIYDFHVVPLDGISEKSGYFTTATTKPNLINNLIMAVETKQIIITDKETFLELIAYQKGNNNTYSAPPGMYDDRVMALALAYNVYRLNQSKTINLDFGSNNSYSNSNNNDSLSIGLFNSYSDFDFEMPEFEFNEDMYAF